MSVVIASELLGQIVAAAEASPGAEVCGLLLGHNVAADDPPSPGGGGRRSLTEGEDTKQTLPVRPLRRLRRHLPLAGEDLVEAMAPCANVAADPARRFEIAPAALLAAHRAARSGGPAVLGHYHSHPSGDPTPSLRDAADAAPDGSLWLIVGGGEVRAFRAVADGELHGRFDPVALRVTG